MNNNGGYEVAMLLLCLGILSTRWGVSVVSTYHLHALSRPQPFKQSSLQSKRLDFLHNDQPGYPSHVGLTENCIKAIERKQDRTSRSIKSVT